MQKTEVKNCWLCKWYGGVYIPSGEPVSKWRNICTNPEFGEMETVKVADSRCFEKG